MKDSFFTKLKNCFLNLMVPSLTYLLGVFLVLSFFVVSTNNHVEIVYPVSLAFLVYIAYFTIEFIRYLGFIKALEVMSAYKDVEVRTYTNLQSMVRQKFGNLHGQYSQVIHELEMKNVKEARFLSTWIHNMKTPVSVSNLILQRYELGQVGNEELLNGLKEENEKLNGQLDMVLNMLRMNEFVKDYLPNKVNLTMSLTELINLNQKQFIYNRVFPKVNKPEKELIVLSDAKWNNLVISQLISNAIKYSRPAKEGPAAIIDFKLMQKEDKVELTIEDHGIGIPEYDISRIYEPFFTGENGRNTKGSSGIGLYFCKEVCDMLGHELTITSKVGMGTKVTITYLSKL